MSGIVGVTGTNLLNTYYTILNVAIDGGCAEIAPDAKGNVSISVAPSGSAFCTEPVASITSSVSLSGKNVYFVPAFDFSGVTISGSAVTLPEGFAADGKSLYKLTGTTITKVSL